MIDVTDHAVLRWIERVGGLDLETVRAEIRTAVQSAVAVGATACTVDGVTYVLKGKVVITLAEVKSPSSFRKNGAKLRGFSQRVKR